MSEKTYAKGIFVTERNQYFMSVNIKFEDFMQFCKQHINEKGYVPLTFGKKKEVGKFGDTHWVALNDWKPESKETTITPHEPEENNPLPF
jgi:hypothetical protein